MKRFYKDVAAIDGMDGYRIELDGRPIKTPAKANLRLPTRRLADAVAEEWRAQGDKIDPKTMPMTSSANAAIDRVEPRCAEVVDELAGYVGQDLICYREPDDDQLIALQEAQWDPVIDWIERELGVRPMVTAGIMPVAQPKALNTAFIERLFPLSHFHLAAFYQIATGLGSVMLALWHMDGDQSFDLVWDAANLDHSYQAQRWGRDEEAERMLEARRLDVQTSARFLSLL